MKRINLEKVLWSLDDMEYPVEVPEDIARQDRRSIEKMLNYSD
jgi:quinolinate synthase